MKSYLFAAATEQELDGTKFKFISQQKLHQMARDLQEAGKDIGDASFFLLLLLDSPPSKIPDSAMEAIRRSFNLLLLAQRIVKGPFERACYDFLDMELFETTNKQS